MKNERLLHLHYMLADHWKALNQLLKIDPDINRIYTFSSAQFKSMRDYLRKNPLNLLLSCKHQLLPLVYAI